MLEEPEELSEEQLQAAAEGDLRVWAAVMLVGTILLSGLGLLFEVLDWKAFLVALVSGMVTALLVWSRNPVGCAWVALGYRFTPLAAMLAAGLGVALAITGEPVGWLVLGVAIVAVPLSMLGLAIITRAEKHGVIPSLWS